ncbi:MAG TPA: efflux RND transporter periplasmic adaptor subunit [Acidobacteriaceae bacterium]|jgi:multidrug resistance efflux pump|nr:efflux RND transporter periplasmic adaptor subunit [Acidobacteriaceae bacterium]
MMKKISIALPLIGVAFLVALLVANARRLPHSQPLIPPPTSPYADTIAASGIVEATGENQNISATVAGVMTKLFVHQGELVKKGAPLFQIDPRDQRAGLMNADANVAKSAAGVQVAESTVLTQQASIHSAAAAIASAKATYQNAAQIAERDIALHKEGIISDQDYVTAVKTRDADYAIWQQQIAVLAQAKAQLKNAQAALVQQQADLQSFKAQRDQQAVVLGQLTVTAPRDGTVLQINNYPGEYIASTPSTAPILFGDTNALQVRVDVDEINASHVRPGAPAVANLKGDSTRKFSLHFVRIDPYMIPKQSLTGNNSERVDVRVLQVIYSFDPPSFPVYAGQQVDVFIQGDRGNQK